MAPLPRPDLPARVLPPERVPVADAPSEAAVSGVPLPSSVSLAVSAVPVDSPSAPSGSDASPPSPASASDEPFAAGAFFVASDEPSPVDEPSSPDAPFEPFAPAGDDVDDVDDVDVVPEPPVADGTLPVRCASTLAASGVAADPGPDADASDGEEPRAGAASGSGDAAPAAWLPLGVSAPPAWC
ncbi:hypothetical protein [Streptomyces cucumeris]|uniref:hypothetical protein n=1 Tax=Streptomyces cucumeris TaxID=2962890 RepID=UPI003EC05AC7